MMASTVYETEISIAIGGRHPGQAGKQGGRGRSDEATGRRQVPPFGRALTFTRKALGGGLLPDLMKQLGDKSYKNNIQKQLIV